MRYEILDCTVSSIFYYVVSHKAAFQKAVSLGNVMDFDLAFECSVFDLSAPSKNCTIN